MSRINDIYDNFINSDYTDTERIKKQGIELDELIRNLVPNTENALEISDACSNHACELERQGFVNGFKYAMQLAAEAFVI